MQAIPRDLLDRITQAAKSPNNRDSASLDYATIVSDVDSLLLRSTEAPKTKHSKKGAMSLPLAASELLKNTMLSRKIGAKQVVGLA